MPPADPREIAAQQALAVAEELAGPDSPVQLIATGLGMPLPGAGRAAWASFLARWANTICPGYVQSVADKARHAAALVAAGEPDLDAADVLDIADAIEARVLEALAQGALLQQVERVLPRTRTLVPATGAETEGLVPLATAVAVAQGGQTIEALEFASLAPTDKLEAKALRAGLSLLPGGGGGL